MAKNKTVYVCQKCGAQRSKWEGRCSDCGSWNSFVEETFQQKASTKKQSRGWTVGDSSSEILQPVTLNQQITDQDTLRSTTGYDELDRVLGGGLVSGSYTLLGGDPGIGKSTLLMQMAGGLAQQGQKVLYVSGEESVSQTALRAQRLGVFEENVEIISESLLENINRLTETRKPSVLILDSIQTIYTEEVGSAPGSVSQVRECAAQIMALAKSQMVSVFLIGHMTKDGSLAGPKVLEHMVDTVLSFEGDSHHQFRLLRALKNRFGPTNELGVFQMDAEGLQEVANPSELFLEERGSDLLGSAVFPAMEGSRPVLCEVQALTTETPQPMPRRTSIGFDTNRVHLLIAVLDKYLNLDLAQNDVFVNVVGGLKLNEPAADLAVASALISSASTQEIPPKACFLGEIGLTGEIRAANFIIERLTEATKLGFEQFLLPASNKKNLEKEKSRFKGRFHFLKSVKDLEKALAAIKNSPEKETKTTSSVNKEANPIDHH